MATHFARGILTEGHLISVRLPSQCHQEARNIPPHRQSRFLASRGLLAELMFMLYGIGELPEIVTVTTCLTRCIVMILSSNNGHAAK